MAYTKLFSTIVTSTIWTEDDRTRIVWITMLALMDRNGEVHASIPGLARLAAVPVDAARTAIGKFLSPDPDSRTKDDEGRRIEEIDGGWSILNFAKYRDMATVEEARAKETERKRRYRERQKRNRNADCPDDVPPLSQDGPAGVHALQKQTAEAEAEADAHTDSSAAAKAGASLAAVLACGVGAKTAKRVAAMPGLTPIAVYRMRLRVEARGEEVKKPTGLLISMIESGDWKALPDPIPPEELCELCKSGVIASVAGVTVNGLVKWNASGLFLDGEQIPAANLRTNAIGLRA